MHGELTDMWYAILRSLAFALSILWVIPVFADTSSVAEATLQLSSERVEVVEGGIERLSQADPQKAIWLIDAFLDGRLGIDAANESWVVSDGTKLRVETRQVGNPTGPLHLLTPDNQVRRALSRAITRLRLQSSSTKERRRAAIELASHPDPNSIELLRQLQSQEQDSDTRERLGIAIAKVDIESTDRKLRLRAARLFESSADITMREPLQSMLELGPNRAPREPDPEVRKAISAAVAAITLQELKIRTLANLIYGLSLGSVLLLAALGLAITFGLMKVINMAHGEMLMLGAYATYMTQSVFHQYLPRFVGLYLVAAVPVAFLMTAAVGILLERLVVRRLYGRPLETLLATWGLSLMLIQTVRSVFGAQNVTVATPEWLSGGWELMPTVVVPYSRVLVLGFTSLVVLFVWYVLQRTSLGLKVRAVTQNRDMAAAMGIRTERVDAWTFALGSGVAGLGGVALSQLGNVGPELGQQHIIDSFMVVVLGGVGNVLGSVLGAVGLGVIAKFLEPNFGAVLGKIAILVVIILFVQWRPQGLFALKGRALEGDV